jgi:hypothetical protein
MILRSGFHPVGRVVHVTFDDRHVLEGVSQHSGGQHAGHSTAKHQRPPAPIDRRFGN